MNMDTQSNRRAFIKAVAVTGAGLALTESAPRAQERNPAGKARLGFDNFSVRAMKWNASQLIDYAASLRLDSLFLTDLDVYESFDETYLRDLKKKADDHGLVIYAGSWSICPTSKFFKNKWGTAEEHLALGIRVARTLQSPAFRCILGMGPDRATPGGIEARMADTIKVCRSARTQALDAGVKIAIENHAGDMQAWELAGLCEEAGKEYVGVTLDTGNATWTMEDPMESLEILAPYVAASALRDSMIWQTPEGATIQWTAMGQGVINYNAFVKRFLELCPTVPVNVEIISGFPRPMPFFQKDYWDVWPKARARDFAKFDALTRLGKMIPPHHSPDDKAEQDYQRSELERSLAYCKETLGLGLK
ncbi:MAG TPA: sugar phosphate isomerase/epimerase [Candidatus Baltobacteraceae bacterium]|jgi:sugar phosphate isomerase/epimerase|nr:sugar phosphate isomerase/epimerase [Candidatus Baltobacteraceae bacterium]